MRRQTFAVDALATAFAVGAPPAWAQRPGGTPAGTAEPRGGGGGGESNGGGGGSAVPRGGGDAGNSGSTSSTPSASPSNPSSGMPQSYVPTPSAERVAYAPQRRGGSGGGGGGGGERAVPRGGSSGGVAAKAPAPALRHAVRLPRARQRE